MVTKLIIHLGISLAFLSTLSTSPLAAKGKCGENNFFSEETVPEIDRSLKEIETGSTAADQKIIVPGWRAGAYRIGDPIKDYGLRANKNTPSLEIKKEGLHLDLTTNPSGQLAIQAITVKKPGYVTEKGIQVGDTSARLIETYTAPNAPTKTPVDNKGAPLVRYTLPGISFLTSGDAGSILEIHIEPVSHTE